MSTEKGGCNLKILENRVKILKNIENPVCQFTDCFRGFEEVDAVKRIFRDETSRILAELETEFTFATIYMRVDNSDGRLMINPDYFLKAGITELYLDIIHELVHVKQFLEGKISDEEVNYTERPLEIEAYKITVDEARALGIAEEGIIDYLDSDLINSEELKQLAENVGVEYTSDSL
jgi:hypothetical protein